MKNNHGRMLDQLEDAVRRNRLPETSGPEEMPYGFDSRLVARLRSARESSPTPWEVLSIRFVPAAAVALCLCLLLERLVPPPAPEVAITNAIFHDFLNR